MNETFRISLPALVAFFLLLVFPVIIIRYLRLRLTWSLLFSMGRMAAQLGLVALYLETIFHMDSLLLNVAWVLVMILVASGAILRQSSLTLKTCLGAALAAQLLTVGLILGGFLMVFPPEKLFSARYLIPLSGMVMGNILRANVVALDRFFSEVQARPETVIGSLTLGADISEATRPFLRKAFSASVAPQLGTIATTGIVSLPGMMTGQILGGSSPAVAIAYQILIMVAIFTAATVSVFLTVFFVRSIAFDPWGCLRPETRKNPVA